MAESNFESSGAVAPFAEHVVVNVRSGSARELLKSDE